MKYGALILGVMLGAGAFASEPLEKFASPIMDLHVKSSVESRDMEALKKISNEFAQSYRFAGSEMYYKEPGKLKIISKAGFLDVSYVINGNTKGYKAVGIHKSIDITHSPGQRQGASAVGLLTPSFLDTMNISSKGSAKIDGREALVYEAHYKEEPGGAYYKFFVDPSRKYVVRQEQYHGDGRPKMTTRFLNPVNQKGIWLPTRTEVLNGEGKRGAVTKMQILGINTGLSDSLFAL